MKVDWGEAVVPGIGLVFGLCFFLQVGDAPGDALQWPYICAAAVLLLGPIVLFNFVLQKGARRPRFQLRWFWQDGRRVVFIFCAAVVYLLLLPYLGFSVANFLLLFIAFKGLGGHGWRKNIAIAGGIALFLHLALVIFMQLSVPRLILGPLMI